MYYTSQDNHQAHKEENDLGNVREASPAKEDEVKRKVYGKEYFLLLRLSNTASHMCATLSLSIPLSTGVYIAFTSHYWK